MKSYAEVSVGLVMTVVVLAPIQVLFVALGGQVMLGFGAEDAPLAPYFWVPFLLVTSYIVGRGLYATGRDIQGRLEEWHERRARDARPR